MDTASADEHEWAQMADEHEQLSPAAGTTESEVCTTEQQPDPQDGRSQSEVVWEEEKQDFQLRIELLTDALRKQGARIEELEREAQRIRRAFSRRWRRNRIRNLSRSPRREGAGSCNSLVI